MFSPSFYRVLRYARPYRRLIVGSYITGVLKFTLALTLPFALGYTIDLIPTIEKTHDYSKLYDVLGILLIAFLLRGVMTYYRSYWSDTADHRTIFDIRYDLLRHVQRLGLSYHSRQRTGETVSRIINDLNTATGLLERGIISIALDTTFLIGVVIGMCVWDWRLALVSMFTLPLYAITFGVLNPQIRKYSHSVQAEMQELSGDLTEKVSAHHVVSSFVREKTEQLRFFRKYRRYFGELIGLIKVRIWLMTIADFLQSFGPVLVITYGAYRVVTDASFTAGEFVTFYGVLSHLYLPTRRLADYSADLQLRLAAMDRVFQLFDETPSIVDAPDALSLPRLEGRIEFDHVTFGYRKELPILRDVSLLVEPGQSIALVGRSGAGKSTLVSLAPRFYDVLAGAVRIDGHDVRALNMKSLREKIGIVHQEPMLFSGTIAENILYGRHGATHEEMLRAAEMAHVHEFVEHLPEGYETLVGERGVTLSGGQKQRVSIARAFLRDPRILILDEATSNLDSGSEQIIQEALVKLMQGRTTLVIAHRLSTIVDCDRVVVLRDGRVAQMGSHSALLHEPGPYRQYCKEQFGDIDLNELHRNAG